jgi:hypothetical protein
LLEIKKYGHLKPVITLMGFPLFIPVKYLYGRFIYLQLTLIQNLIFKLLIKRVSRLAICTIQLSMVEGAIGI